MKLKLPKLHTQIVLALMLGAIFGSIFNVSKSSLIIKHGPPSNIQSSNIKSWNQFTFMGKDTVTFPAKSQIEILTYYKANKSGISKIRIDDFRTGDKNIPSQEFTQVTSIEKEKTIATGIKWLGDIFIRLLTMIAVPLVLASLTVGAASLGDIKKFARIGGKTILFYMSTTAIAITIGLGIANLMQPGQQMSADTKSRLLSAYSGDASSKIETIGEYDFFDEIVKMVPKNPIASMADGDMLQVVIFAVLLGLTLSLIAKEKSQIVISFLDGLTDALIKLVDFIMMLAPIGVFALIAATVSEFGFDILQTLIWYSAAVIIGLTLHTVVTYPVILKIFTKMKILNFFKGIRRAQTIAFSTSSSAATLPVTMECCQDNLGISKSISSFVLPLGATINMDGTALYQGVAAVFIAQVFGMDLSITQQLTIVFTATLASIGTAPVPGVGLIMLVIILKAVGIPEVGVALILGVDRILDMCRTITNITGDATAATVIASSENEIMQAHLENA